MHLRFAVLLILCMTTSTFGRGAGVVRFLVSDDGKLIASLGDTSGAIVDDAASIIYRYRDGKVVALPLDRPDQVLWSTPAQPQMRYRTPYWNQLPGLIYLFEEEHITALDKKTGKQI